MVFLIKRFKNIKTLVFKKLDDILNEFNRFDTLHSALEKLATLLASSLRNQNSLLKASTHLVDEQQKLSQVYTNKINLLEVELSSGQQKILQAQDEGISSLKLSLLDSLKHEILDSLKHEILDSVSNDLLDVRLKIQQQLDFSTQKQVSKSEFILHKLQDTFDSLDAHINDLPKKLDTLDGLCERLDLIEKSVGALQSLLVETQSKKSGIYLSAPQVIVAEPNHVSLKDPEVELISHLYSYLPSRRVVDIGANVGFVSKALLEVGYEVYAFEPNPSVFEKMRGALGHHNSFHPYKLAIGAKDTTMELFLVERSIDDFNGEDASLYSSLRKHPLVGGLEFSGSICVPVRSLESLHTSLEVPYDIGLVKIDTEGFDVEVIRGMGEFRYPVVITEFWDKRHAFGSETGTSLSDLVDLMRKRNYLWYIVIYRKGLHDTAFYCNRPVSLEETWGNTFFFQNYNVFCQALKWCSATLPTTVFGTDNISKN